MGKLEVKIIELLNWYSTELSSIKTAHASGYLDDADMVDQVDGLQKAAVNRVKALK